MVPAESSDTVPKSVELVGLLAGPAGLLSEYEGGFTWKKS